MARFFNKRSQKIGTAPGTPVFVGNKRLETSRMEALIYKEKGIETKEIDFEDYIKADGSEKLYWLNITGIHDVELIQKIALHYKLHILLVEDILNTTQRAKFEEYEDYMYLVLKMLHFDEKTESLESEQVSIVLFNDKLITFQEIPDDVFGPIRERLDKPQAKIRKRGMDYLAYALMDSIVDRYILIIEQFGDRIEMLEDNLLRHPEESHLNKINLYKREINFLRKTIRPVREMVIQFRKSEQDTVKKETVPYLADLEDHVTQATEAIEIYKDMLNDLLNTYNSSMNNKLNDILRVLTIFSVIFIPLTFLAGIYGTNFEYLPELNYKFAYPVFWGVLVIIAIGMIVYFKRKRWL